MRYSGSPLPMGFGEAGQVKSVCLVEFNGTAPTVTLANVPTFQQLERIRGNWDAIVARIRLLAESQSQAWLEVVYDGEEVTGDLRERLEQAICETNMEVLRVKNNRIIARVLNRIHDEETLDDLNVDDVFERCLASHDVSEDQRLELRRTYHEAITSLHEDDVHAE
jgi:exonuclease SbcD